ncbi:MAG: hypothetical protein ACPLRX_04530 [Candidatus Saccharicenans sp.]
MALQKNLLLKLLLVINNQYSEKDLRDLITAMVDELLPVIKKNRGYHLYLANYEPRDIAYLAISNLFIKNSKGRYPVLERLFDWKTVEKFLASNEEDFQRYLRSVLLRRLKQTYYFLSNEITPERNKIKREILYALKKTSQFKIKNRSNNPQITFRPKGEPSVIYSNEIDGLLSLCLKNRLGGLQIPKFFRRLAEILENNGAGLEMSLSGIYDLFVSVQKYYLMVEAGAAFYSPDRYPVYDVNKNLQQWFEELMNYNKRLVGKYVQKKRINHKEKEAWLLALNDLFRDWQDGGQEKSLYNYLKRHLPEITPDDYRQNKRMIFEYLVKNSREFLKQKLEQINYQCAQAGK